MNSIPSQLKNTATFWSVQFLAAALTIAVVVTMVLAAQSFLWQYTVSDVVRSRMDALDRNAFLTESRVRRLANDMFFVKSVTEAELVRNPKAPVATETLRGAVKTMMLAQSKYDNIRLLSPSGMEIYRVNWQGGLDPLYEVPDKELQDKSDRYFYRETLQASPGDVVFSPMDLDVEHGQIVQPPKPTLRVSGQIVGPDGKLRAIVVLNQTGELYFRELRQERGQPWQSMLLNADGYWLVGATPDSEWGFQLPGRKGKNLKTEDPELWNKISTNRAGWFEDKGNLYCFERIDPLNAGSDNAPLRMPVVGDERLHWIFLTKVPDEVVWANVQAIRLGTWESGAMAVAVLVPVVSLGLFSLRRRQLAVGELSEAFGRGHRHVAAWYRGDGSGSRREWPHCRSPTGPGQPFGHHFSRERPGPIAGKNDPGSRSRKPKGRGFCALLRCRRIGRTGQFRILVQERKVREMAFYPRGQAGGRACRQPGRHYLPKTR